MINIFLIWQLCCIFTAILLAPPSTYQIFVTLKQLNIPMANILSMNQYEKSMNTRQYHSQNNTIPIYCTILHSYLFVHCQSYDTYCEIKISKTTQHNQRNSLFNCMLFYFLLETGAYIADNAIQPATDCSAIQVLYVSSSSCSFELLVSDRNEE